MAGYKTKVNNQAWEEGQTKRPASNPREMASQFSTQPKNQGPNRERTRLVAAVGKGFTAITSTINIAFSAVYQ